MTNTDKWHHSLLIPGLVGLLFGAGLELGGMTEPAKVRGFLDVFGAWDPTLMFVLVGALVVMAVAWRIQRGMLKPVVAAAFSVPTRTELTPRLIGGSALFGIGWGVAGLCPGPAISSVALNPIGAVIFVVSMLAGMTVARLFWEH